MPFNVIHTAIEFEGADPRAKQYPAGTCFDCDLDSIEVRYDHSSGGWVLTQVLRVVGARNADGDPSTWPPLADTAAATESFSVQRDIEPE